MGAALGGVDAIHATVMGKLFRGRQTPSKAHALLPDRHHAHLGILHPKEVDVGAQGARGACHGPTAGPLEGEFRAGKKGRHAVDRQHQVVEHGLHRGNVLEARKVGLVHDACAFLGLVLCHHGRVHDGQVLLKSLRVLLLAVAALDLELSAQGGGYLARGGGVSTASGRSPASRAHPP